MKTTKDQAKQEVEVYGELLKERAVISEIEVENKRNQTWYTFQILDGRYQYLVTCEGIKQLALVLTSMWSSYRKARTDLGFDVDLAC